MQAFIFGEFDYQSNFINHQRGFPVQNKQLLQHAGHAHTTWYNWGYKHGHVKFAVDLHT